MKYIIQCLLVAGLSLFLFSGCIDDESKGAYIPLSEIELKTEQDTFYVDYGSVAVIPTPEVIQTIKDKGLKYEWRASHIDRSGGSVVTDSLKYISFDPELQYVFPRLGEFRVRLRVSNGDVSVMHDYRVFVQTPFIEGLFVLSADGEGKGRTSFLRTRQESDIWKGSEYEFKTHAVEAVNPEISLKDPTDVNVGGNGMLFLSCSEIQKIYLLDNKTFDLLYVFDMKQELPWMKPVAVLTAHKKGGSNSANEYFLVSDHGSGAVLVPRDYMIYEEPKYFPSGAVYDKWCVYASDSWGTAYCYFVDRGQARIDYTAAIWGGAMIENYNSGTVFEGTHILNLTVDERIALWTVTLDKSDPSKVKITKFNDCTYPAGVFNGPEELEYEASGPLTLNDQSDMVMAHKDFGVCFYNNGSELYRWKYMEAGVIQKLPTESVLSADGEITCIELSTDRLFLYIGVWNSRESAELKGSVLIYDVMKQKVVKTYPNVADKPVKVFYKYS